MTSTKKRVAASRSGTVNPTCSTPTRPGMPRECLLSIDPPLLGNGSIAHPWTLRSTALERQFRDESLPMDPLAVTLGSFGTLCAHRSRGGGSLVRGSDIGETCQT